MRKNFLLLLLAAMFTMVSCNYNEDQVTVNTTEADQEAIVDGKVPLSRAISNADFIFRNTEGFGAKKRTVKSVDVLTTSNSNSVIANTRSGVDGQEQPVAYVVNYENNEGFAILAADTKLPPVIGIGDEGNFNTQGFIDFVRNNATRTGGSELNPAQEVQYAVINNSLLLPQVNIGDAELQGVDTTIMLKCLPLVRTKWGQRDPYDYYSKPDPTNPNLKSAAGCVPVAAAQTLASLCYHHNWRPTTQLSSEYSMDWYTINRMLYDGIIGFEPLDYSANALAAASLIRAIGYDINANYSYDGTGSNNIKLQSTYSKLGLEVTAFGNESDTPAVTTTDIFDMIIVKNLPVTTQALLHNSNIGHSFVLDGWLRLEYSLLGFSMIENEVGLTIRQPDNFQHNFDLVHVNFGWKGVCDGYYLPDAFDLTETKYREYKEANDEVSDAYTYVFDINVEYLIYDLP